MKIYKLYDLADYFYNIGVSLEKDRKLQHRPWELHMRQWKKKKKKTHSENGNKLYMHNFITLNSYNVLLFCGSKTEQWILKFGTNLLEMK
jgi:hypothetical protein